MATITQVKQAYGIMWFIKTLILKLKKLSGLSLSVQMAQVNRSPKNTGKSCTYRVRNKELGHQVSVGYFSQQRVDQLNLENSVLDEAMQKVKSKVHTQDVRGILGTFLFRGDDVFKKVKVLSGGKKSISIGQVVVISTQSNAS